MKCLLTFYLKISVGSIDKIKNSKVLKKAKIIKYYITNIKTQQIRNLINKNKLSLLLDVVIKAIKN